MLGQIGTEFTELHVSTTICTQPIRLHHAQLRKGRQSTSGLAGCGCRRYCRRWRREPAPRPRDSWPVRRWGPTRPFASPSAPARQVVSHSCVWLGRMQCARCQRIAVAPKYKPEAQPSAAAAHADIVGKVQVKEVSMKSPVSESCRWRLLQPLPAIDLGPSSLSRWQTAAAWSCWCDRRCCWTTRCPCPSA